MSFVLRHYTFPLLLAALLHAAAAWALYQGWHPDKEIVNVIQPQKVMANLIVLDAPPPKRANNPPAPTPAPPKESKPEPKAEDLAAKRTQEEKARADAAKKAAEAQKLKQEQEKAALQREREERLARLSDLAQSSLDQAIAEESAELAAGSEEQVVRSYHAAIYDLVRTNWSRPPSARIGMSARLQVELIPTGEVVSVTVIDSSGNNAFDRSAERAVRQARQFEVPDENRLFEEHFRRFYLLFQPEDLMR